MAAYTSTKSGNWSDSTVWGGVPNAADTVTIASGHTVTLDTTGCVCLTCTVNSGGTLTATGAANWNWTAQNDITVNSGGNISIDMSASAFSGTINLNGADATGNGYHFVVLDGGSITLKGKPKTRWTRLNGAVSAAGTSITVDDATGWNTGDLICLATTSAYATTPALDLSAGTNTVSGNTVSNMTAFSYAHADRGLVGNFSSNLTIKPKTAGRPCCVFLYQTSTASWTREIRDVCFRDFLRSTQTARDAALYVYGNGLTSPTYTAISNNAFYNNAVMSFQYILQKASLPRVNNIFFTGTNSYHVIGASSTANFFAGTETGSVVFNGPIGGTAINGPFAFLDNSGKQILENCHFTATRYGIKSQYALELNNSSVSSCFNAVTLSAGQFFTANSDFSKNNTTTFSHNQYCDARLTDTLFAGTLNDSTFPLALDFETISLINKNGSVTTQEIYRPYMETKRENSITNRSPSSIAIYPTRVSTDCQRTLSIPCASGKSIRLVGYVKKSHASNISATVAITGLGSAWGGFTAAANTDWQIWDSGNITNSSGNDGNFTLTYTANSSSGTTNVAYFDGVVDSPFVTLARHYGFTFDESNPVRKVNPYTVASEATAAAYTGATINAGTKRVTFGAGTIDNLEKLYDYSQAWGCLNLTAEMPWVRAGALLSLNTGWTVADPVFPLATFGGGTVEWNSTGNKTGGYDSTTFDFKTAGIYNFADATLGGTITLVNTSGGAVTVEVPTGTSYTNTGPDITVELPVITANISITGMPTTAGAERRLQIINNDAEAAAAWQASTAYALGDMVLRTTGVGSEQTAGLYMRCTLAGTSGGTEPTWDTTVGNTTSDGTVTWTTYSILYYHDDPASATLTPSYIDGEEFLAGETATIRFAEEDPAVGFKTYSTATVATASGFSALVAATADETYATYGLSGAAQDTTFSPNYVANYIVLDADTDFSGAAAYAYYCYLLTTDEGMYRFWGGLTALDSGNIRNNSDVISLYFDESAGFVKQTDDVRIFRKDGLRPAIDPTTGGNGIEINWRVPVNVVSTGGSALTPSESAQLMALPSASTTTSAIFAQAVVTPIHADMRKINGTEAQALLQAAGDPWITNLPGAYPAGSAGNLIGNFLATLPPAIRAELATELSRMDAKVSEVPAAVLSAATDGTTTLAESIRLQNAVLAGKVSGAGTGTETFRDLADTKNRVVATVDANGNRTTIVRDAT